MSKRSYPKIRTHSKNTELVEARRNQIVNGALRVLVKKGYDNTSIREIAEACDMSIGSLYHYVGSKEDILYLFIEKGMSSALRLIEEYRPDAKTPQHALRDAIDLWFRIMDDIQDMVIFTYHELGNLRGQARQRILDIDERLTTVFESVLSDGVKTGDFKINDVKLLANTMVVIGHMWAFRRWYLHGRYTLDEFIKEQTELLIKIVS